MTDRQRRNLLTGASAAGGASATSLALDSDALQLALLRRHPRYKVRYTAGADAGLKGGSGEARMASNNALLARKHGINGVFVNPEVTWWPEPYGAASAEINHAAFSKADRAALSAIALGKENPGVEKIANVPVSEWEELFAKVSEGTAKKADLKKRIKVLSGILDGKYDTFAVGELSDNLKLLGENAINGKIPMMSARKALTDRSRFIFSGERDMNYSTIDRTSHIDVLKNDRIGNKAHNIGKHVGFGANYNQYSTKYIPASAMDTGLMNRSNLLSRVQHAIDRRRLEKFITSSGDKLGVPASVAGKKIIFLSGGSAGPLAPDKIKEVLRATEGMDNVHILAQIGSGVRGKHKWYGNIMPELEEAVRSGRITITNRVSPDLITRLYNGADLNLAYGGSSSATEMTGVRTPSIFMHDSNLNSGNIEFAKRRGAGNLRDFDSAAVGIYSRIKDYLKRNPGATVEDAYNSIKDLHIAQDTLKGEKNIFDRAMRMGDSGVAAARKRFADDIRELLNPGVRESASNTGRVKGAIKDMLARNKQVVRDTKYTLLADAERLRGVFKNLGKVPLKYKIPAIAVGAAVPAVVTHQALKPKNTNFGDKIMDVFRNFGRKR